MKEITTSCHMKQVGNRGYIYFLKSSHFYKIGRSISDVEGRIKTHISSNPSIEVIGVYRVKSVLIEKELHKKFIAKRHKRTEWFILDEKEIDDIKEILENKQKEFYAE